MDELAASLPDFPFAFHVAPRQRAASIWADGLQPGNANVDFGSVAARPGCVYFGSRSLLVEGWLHEWTGLREGPDGDDLILGIDLSTVDPRRILPDEDAFGLGAQVPLPDGLPAWQEGASTRTQGQWAEDIQLGAQPGVAAQGIAARGTLAIRGAIRPNQLTVHVIDGYAPRPLGALTGFDPATLLAALANS